MATIVANASGGTRNWSDTATWTGGVVPSITSDVQLKSTSGAVTITAGAGCRSLDCTGYTNTLTHNASATLDIGDATAGLSSIALKLVSGMTYTKNSVTTSAVHFGSTSATHQTIDCGGQTLGNFQVDGVGSYYAVNATFACASITLSNGTLDTAGYTCTTNFFSTAGTPARTLTLGASTINLLATSGNVWAGAVTGMTLNAGTSEIVINATSASARTFDGGGLTFNNLTYTLAGSTGGLTINSSNTFNILSFSDASNARTLTLANTSTTTVTTFRVNGTNGALMSVTSAGAGSATISRASGVVSVDYVALTRIPGVGGASFYAGVHSTDSGGNTNWVFTAPVVTSAQMQVKLVSVSPQPTRPTSGTQWGVHWSPDGKYVALSLSVSPYFYWYYVSGSSYTLMSNPAVLPANNTTCVAWHPSGDYLVVGVSNGTASLKVYYKTGTDSSAVLTGITTQPTATAAVAIGTMNWSPNGNFLIYGSTSSPYFKMYSFSASGLTSTLTTVTTPMNTGPASRVTAAGWSSDGSVVVAGFDTSPIVSAFSLSGTGTSATLTKMADSVFSVLPSGAITTNAAFSPDGQILCVTTNASTYLFAYSISGSGSLMTFTKITITAAAEQFAQGVLKWKPDSTKLLGYGAITGGPISIAYSKAGTSLTKDTAPSQDVYWGSPPALTAMGWAPDSAKIVLGGSDPGPWAAMLVDTGLTVTGTANAAKCQISASGNAVADTVSVNGAAIKVAASTSAVSVTTTAYNAAVTMLTVATAGAISVTGVAYNASVVTAVVINAEIASIAGTVNTVATNVSVGAPACGVSVMTSAANVVTATIGSAGVVLITGAAFDAINVVTATGSANPAPATGTTNDATVIVAVTGYADSVPVDVFEARIITAATGSAGVCQVTGAVNNATAIVTATGTAASAPVTGAVLNATVVITHTAEVAATSSAALVTGTVFNATITYTDSAAVTPAAITVSCAVNSGTSRVTISAGCATSDAAVQDVSATVMPNPAAIAVTCNASTSTSHITTSAGYAPGVVVVSADSAIDIPAAVTAVNATINEAINSIDISADYVSVLSAAFDRSTVTVYLLAVHQEHKFAAVYRPPVVYRAVHYTHEYVAVYRQESFCAVQQERVLIAERG